MEHREVSIHVAPRDDHQGIIVVYRNDGSSLVKVSVPHPRETIFLIKSATELPKEFYPMRWDSLPPIVLEPKQCVSVAIGLVPYWLDISDTVDVLCKIQIDDSASGTADLEITGKINVDLPTRDQLRSKNREKTATGKAVPRPLQVVLSEEGEKGNRRAY